MAHHRGRSRNFSISPDETASVRGSISFNPSVLSIVQIEHKERLHALWEIAKSLAAEHRLHKIIAIIVSQVPELLDAGRCTLYFVDKERRELVVHRGASHGRRKNLVSWIFGQYNAPELPFDRDSDEFRSSMSVGIAGFVATTGKILNVVDAHQDPRFNPKMDLETGYRTRSILCVPMIDAHNEIIGVVQAINKNPLFNRFDEEDETLLKTFSALAALAVRNSQLLQRTQLALKQSEALLAVTKALSSELQMESLIQLVVSKAQELLLCERCTVFVVDHDRSEMYTSENMSFGMGPPLPVDRDRSTLRYFPLNRGIAGAVATTGKTINIPDAYQDDRFNKQLDIETKYRTRAILCMAILNRNNLIIGVIQCMNKIGVKPYFDEKDVELLEAFSAQAAIAIENSRLFSQTEKLLNHALSEERNLKFMLAVTKNLFQSMHLNSMHQQITLQVNRLLRADDCALFLVNTKDKYFYLAESETASSAAAPARGSMLKMHAYEKGIVGYVIRTGQVVRISSEAHKDPRFDPDVDQRKNKVTHSVLCCPIKSEPSDGSEPEVIGVISVRDEKDRGGFDTEEEHLLKVFCAQAAVAITSAQSFRNLIDRSHVAAPKTSDTNARKKLIDNWNMNLGSGDISKFEYKMEDIQLQKAIGSGSYGEVYKALINGEEVAVKKLHVKNLRAEQVDAFCKEASVMCQLSHVNIVPFIGAVTNPSHLCIITQFCDRGSLADLLLDVKGFQMTWAMKIKFALDAAQGMRYLHHDWNPAILHRDLKSDNLLVTQGWTVKVADFGLTRFLSDRRTMTQVGTPMWMAPEVILGKKYTEKADVYAFGIILWEILTRREPYESKDTMQIVVEVVNDNLRPDIPPEYDQPTYAPFIRLMKDCWHREEQMRPPFKLIVERLDQIFKVEMKGRQVSDLFVF